MRLTKSLSKRPGSVRFVELPGNVSVFDIVDASRRAALAFLDGAQGLWGRRELAAWLVGDYAAATSASCPFIEERSPSSHGLTPLEDVTIEKLLRRARRRILDLLATRSEWGASLAQDAVDRGLVIGVEDHRGTVGYAPVDVPGLRLVDRLSALFIADYLTRPQDYLALEICHECEELSFEGIPVHFEDCEMRGPGSAIVVRKPTMQGVG